MSDADRPNTPSEATSDVSETQHGSAQHYALPPEFQETVDAPASDQPALGSQVEAAPIAGAPQSTPAESVAAGPTAVAPTNTLAIISLVMSLVGLVTAVTAIAGVICGHIALNQIKRTGEQGHGLAVAGLAVGYVIVGLGVLSVAFFFIFFFIALAAGMSAGSAS